MATSVVYGWAGAVIGLCKPKNSKIDDRWIDGLIYHLKELRVWD